MLKHDPLAPGGDKKPPVITWAALDECFRNIATQLRRSFRGREDALRASKRLKVWI